MSSPQQIESQSTDLLSFLGPPTDQILSKRKSNDDAEGNARFQDRRDIRSHGMKEVCELQDKYPRFALASAEDLKSLDAKEVKKKRELGAVVDNWLLLASEILTEFSAGEVWAANTGVEKLILSVNKVGRAFSKIQRQKNCLAIQEEVTQSIEIGLLKRATQNSKSQAILQGLEQVLKACERMNVLSGHFNIEQLEKVLSEIRELL